MCALPRVRVVPPGDPEQKESQATPKEQEADEIDFLELLHSSLAPRVKTKEARGPVEDCNKNQRDGIGHNAHIKCPTPVQVGHKRVRCEYIMVNTPLPPLLV